MKLGFALRRTFTFSLFIVRSFLDLLFYLFWLLLDPSKFKKIKLEKIKNLLVIYGGSIGDVYNAIGIMNSVASNHPNIQVHFLTLEKNRKFVKNPKIKVVDLQQARQLMKQKKFDAVVLLQGIIYKPLLFTPKMYLEILNIPYRVACDNLHIGLAHKQIMPLLTRKLLSLNSNGFQDQIDTFNFLGLKIDKPKFYYTKESEEFAKNFIRKNKISKNEKIIFLHIGGGSILASLKEDANGCPSHLWPFERWAKVADHLIKKYNARIIFTGVNDEKQLIEKVISKIKNKKKAISLAGNSSIEESASLLKRGDLIISIDTGTAHIAAQTGIPLIDLFSSFSPKNTSTIASSEKKADIYHSEVCTNCRVYTNCPEKNNICMISISVEEILSAADKLLKK